MRLAEEAKLRNQMSAKRAKAEAERKHQVISEHLFSPFGHKKVFSYTALARQEVKYVFMDFFFYSFNWLNSSNSN